MSRIIVSDIAQFGVQNAIDVKANKSENYKQLVDEADIRIKKNHLHDAYVYKNAANCIAANCINYSQFCGEQRYETNKETDN